MRKESITRKDKVFEVAVEYPVSSNDVINKFLSDKMQVRVADFTSGGTDPEGDMAYTLNIRYRVTQSPNTVTYTFLDDYYTGGAHDGLDIYTFTFDKNSGKQLVLTDFVPAAKFATLQTLVRAELTRKYVTGAEYPLDPQQIEQGTAKPEDFSAFAIEGDTITFTFQPYQIGPWSAGSQEVSLKLSKLN